MKNIILFLIIPFFVSSQTFKKDFFSKSNIIHIGNNGYIEKDKFLHSTAGAFIGSSVYMYAHYKTDNIFLSTAISMLSVFIVGEAKELHDRNNGGKFSNEDLLATTFGGFTGVFTKIVQIDIQQKNKILSEQYKQEFENLNR